MGKPIIGIAGGIGSGKSCVAEIFGELGGLVLSADDHVRSAYARQDVRDELRKWWGGDVVKADGAVNRAEIAKRIFLDEKDRERLERLIHPIVSKMREDLMASHATDPAVKAFVWDVPLLFETGLNQRCDAVVFVDAPHEERLRRVQNQRNWDVSELLRREKSQWALDKKLELSDYVISNTAGLDAVRDQVRNVFSQILQKTTSKS